MMVQVVLFMFGALLVLIVGTFGSRSLCINAF